MIPGQVHICPKCGKPAWAPYVMSVTKKYGSVYRYKVYRHGGKNWDRDGRQHATTPRKCTVRSEFMELLVKEGEL